MDITGFRDYLHRNKKSERNLGYVQAFEDYVRTERSKSHLKDATQDDIQAYYHWKVQQPGKQRLSMSFWGIFLYYDFLGLSDLSQAAERIVLDVRARNKRHQHTRRRKTKQDWFSRLFSRLHALKGEQVATAVVGNADEYYRTTSRTKKGLWMQHTLERLEETLNDRDLCCHLLSSCACPFPETRIEPMRVVYHQTRDIDAVIRAMHDTDAQFYSYPRREGTIVYIHKDPNFPTRYAGASTEEEQRYQYCHCPKVRASILTARVNIPHIWCYCSAGWDKQLWEGVLGQPLLVKPVKTVLWGDALCEFAIQLPSEVIRPDDGAC